MTGPRPAGRHWTLANDDMLPKLLTSGIKPRLIARKMKRISIRWLTQAEDGSTRSLMEQRVAANCYFFLRLNQSSSFRG
jgi:hypothetical protein